MTLRVELGLSPILSHRFTTLWDAVAESPDVFAFLDEHSTASSQDRLDVLLIDQRRRPESGASLSSEDYLRACPDIESDPLLKLELVCGELRVATVRGEPQDPESIVARFPDLPDK